MKAEAKHNIHRIFHQNGRIDHLGSVAFLSSFDAQSQFWEVYYSRTDIDKMIFTSSYELYRHLKLRFVLGHSSEMFHCNTEVALSPVKYLFSSIYPEYNKILLHSPPGHAGYMTCAFLPFRKEKATLKLNFTVVSLESLTVLASWSFWNV